MNTIITLMTIVSLAASPMAACPKVTNTYCYNACSGPSDNVYCWKETEWPLGETVTEEYVITYEEFTNR